MNNNMLFSENFSKKKKRGRPIKNIELEKYEKQYPKLSNRQLLNKYYCNLFLQAIIKDNELLKKYKLLSFIIIPKKKTTILTELGKVYSKKSLKQAITLANHICTNKLATDKAISYIRKSRKLGKDKIKGTISKLLKVIDNAYLSTSEKEKVVLGFLMQLKEDPIYK